MPPKKQGGLGIDRCIITRCLRITERPLAPETEKGINQNRIRKTK
jgi:hypothetical protein